MWKTIYIAHTADQAERLQQLLTANGFLVQIKSSGGKHNKAYELRLPLSEAEDAYEVLCENNFRAEEA